jgi:uncharacterized membrane protein (GlpM family)
LNEIVIRFVVGGAVVSFFAILGDVLKPKSFAGLFGAAPSVALATLALTIADRGNFYAATEARSMILGAIAFFIYAWFVSFILVKYRLPTLPAAGASLVLWLISAYGLWSFFIR